MHKPSTTSKPQSALKQENAVWNTARQSRFDEAQRPAESSRGRGVKAQGGLTGRLKKQLAFLWTVAEHLMSSFVNLWALSREEEVAQSFGRAHWTSTYHSENDEEMDIWPIFLFTLLVFYFFFSQTKTHFPLWQSLNGHSELFSATSHELQFQESWYTV